VCFELNGGGAQAATASNESAAASTSEDTSAVQTQSVPEGDFPETTEKIFSTLFSCNFFEFFTVIP
jgi:hypothetical protein